MSAHPPELLKVSELARRSGVPVATIKHYLREGLLPAAKVKTSRNMAWYHPALVTRIKAIKELQQKRFLPLKVIGQVLDGADPYRSEETEAALRDALNQTGRSETRTRRELETSGVRADQLDLFERVGLLTPKSVNGETRYEADDLALLRTFRAARRAGLSEAMLPHTIVKPYVAALRELVRVELATFREGLLSGEGNEDVASLVEAAARLSEQLVVQLRRKLLLPTLRELVAEQERERPRTKPAARRPRRQRRKR